MVRNKSDIRKEKLYIRRNMSPEEVTDFSKFIAERVLELDEYILANDVLIYCDYNNEVATDYIINKALSSRKNVYVPRVNGDDMEFFNISSLDDLEVSQMGIREPLEDICSAFGGNPFAIVLMPLSAFDRTGNRIGYGKGYYDKYLTKMQTGIKVGLAYSFQETDFIETYPTDIKLDYIITEKEYIEVKNG